MRMPDKITLPKIRSFYNASCIKVDLRKKCGDEMEKFKDKKTAWKTQAAFLSQ